MKQQQSVKLWLLFPALTFIITLLACRDYSPLHDNVPELMAPAAATRLNSAESESMMALQSTPVLTYKVDGGHIGFCDRLIIEADGQYRVDTCRHQDVEVGLLRESDFGSLQAWMQNLAAFSFTVERDGEGADRLRTSLDFYGFGLAEPSSMQQQLMLDWANGLLTRLQPQPVRLADSAATAEEVTFCPEIDRPALLAVDPEDPQQLALINPDRLLYCDFTIEHPPIGQIKSAAGHLFFPVSQPETDSVVVWQMTREGTAIPLKFTETPFLESEIFVFDIAHDASRIAWARTTVDFELSPVASYSDLKVANLDGSGERRLLNQAASPGTTYVEPIGFSLHGDTLFYALQPLGFSGTQPLGFSGTQPPEVDRVQSLSTGDLVPEFSGRFNSLYRITRSGEAPQLVYACSLPSNALCISDISADGSAFVYGEPASGTINIVGTEGNPLAALTWPTADYVGQAHFNSIGTVAFLGATLSEQQNVVPGQVMSVTIKLIEPPYEDHPKRWGASDQTVHLGPWLDDQDLIYFTFDKNGESTMSILALDGRVKRMPRGDIVAVVR